MLAARWAIVAHWATCLYNPMKGKSYLVNQRWRWSTCLRHQCYDIGCYPWYSAWLAVCICLSFTLNQGLINICMWKIIKKKYKGYFNKEEKCHLKSWKQSIGTFINGMWKIYILCPFGIFCFVSLCALLAYYFIVYHCMFVFWLIFNRDRLGYVEPSFNAHILLKNVFCSIRLLYYKMFVLNFQPKTKVVWRLGRDFKPHSKDWRICHPSGLQREWFKNTTFQWSDKTKSTSDK